MEKQLQMLSEEKFSLKSN